jgi:hypothetical protein
MWNMKCFVIPGIIGAAGIETKGLKNICKQYQETFNRLFTNKTAVLGTSHIIRKVLQSEN